MTDVLVDVIDRGPVPSEPPLAGAAPPSAPPNDEPRRNTGLLRESDYWAIFGAAAAATAFTSIVYFVLAPFSGILGFLVLTYLVFVGFYAYLVSMTESGPAVRDRVASVVIHSLAVLMLTALIIVVLFTLWKGHKALGHWNFFSRDASLAGPLDPLSVGGIVHAIIGTLEQISLALAMSVPLGVICALFLNEVPGRFSRLVRTIAEAMTALPSIVAGLFIYATYILILGKGRSGFAAALALTVMMLPIIIRASDVVIRLVPSTLREAALATGASQWRTMLHVVLPTARSGLVTAVILGTARGIGETSPVLLTAGFTAGTNTNPFDGNQVSLPLATFEYVRSSQPNIVARGFGSASVLLLLVLVLFVVARILGGRPAGQLTRRQMGRRARMSRRDAKRFQNGPVAASVPHPVPSAPPS